jgi:hypothetical protein
MELVKNAPTIKNQTLLGKLVLQMFVLLIKLCKLMEHV